MRMPYRTAACAAIMLFLLIALDVPGSDAAGIPHHDLTVSIQPEKHSLAATDTVTLPEDFPREFVFVLHAGLNPKIFSPGITLSEAGKIPGPVPLESFKVTLPEQASSFTVEYRGEIHHPVESDPKHQARGIDSTPGSISREGIYLSGSSGWYPLLEPDLMTFTLTVELPAAWNGVSQGSRMPVDTGGRASKAGWDSPEPQNEIYLVASRFSLYEKRSNRVAAMVFLRSPEEDLATRYLDATIRYIDMYEKLIGPYPYEKFALVENFWETGFGMPSFTLLGPAVIRLPFIINTSYPHEILHNWWGNSVYTVYEAGNWSEGLTAYLADHLLKEQQGAGAEYRLTTLQKYTDYVLSGRDFPLTEFTSRHSASTEAIGYGKGLMFFHMLRRKLGDRAFVGGLRHFYQNFKFRYATYPDLMAGFEAVSGKDLKTEFEQWVTRAGAPEIKLRDVETERGKDGYRVKAVIEQVQPGEAYQLEIPVAATLEGREAAYQTVLKMRGRKQTFVVDVPERPLRLDVDPEFDIFRRLDSGEIPPALTLALGARKMLIILPSKAPRKLRKAYEVFAESLSRSGPDEVDVTYDRKIKKLPNDRSVAILGWQNRFFEQALPAWAAYELNVTGDAVLMGKTELARDNHAFVLAGRHPEDGNNALLFIAADKAASLPGLARKLPHYHQYSYLAFEGEQPENVAKGRWPVVDSPLTGYFDTRSKDVRMGELSPRDALAALPPVYSRDRMMKTIEYLSSSRLKGRKIGTQEIDLAAAYIAQGFREAGLAPGGDNGGYYQAWNVEITGEEKRTDGSVGPECRAGCLTGSLKNVIGVIPGKKPELSDRSVVIGAHYDHLGAGGAGGLGKIHPGADDNASGVAVLLELARVLNESLTPDRSIVFAAFTGEEEGRVGSRYYVNNEKAHPAEKAIGMINLDTVGRLGKRKLLVLGAGSAREWVHIFRGAGFVTGVGIETVSGELDSSDQKSFREAGVPAVQLFSGPHPDYHRPGDTADRIDPDGLVKTAAVAKEVIEYLAHRDTPLAGTGKTEDMSKTASKTERKVSLGTMPDFAYPGKGVRLSGVVEGSPAEAAGLKEGDVITGINEVPVGGLKDLSDILKTLKPGDKIFITVTRDGIEKAVETRVKEK